MYALHCYSSQRKRDKLILTAYRFRLKMLRNIYVYKPSHEGAFEDERNCKDSFDSESHVCYAFKKRQKSTPPSSCVAIYNLLISSGSSDYDTL